MEDESSNGGKDEGESLSSTSTAVPETHLEFTAIAAAPESSKDPIRMFAALPPRALRVAQNDALSMVTTIPKLVSLDQEMKEIEIRIRRARKYRQKAQDSESSKGIPRTVNEADLEHMLDGVRKTAIA